jgi:hypothetical protein
MKLISYEKHVGAKRVNRFTATPTRAEKIDAMLAQLADPVTEHGNSRPVLIVGPINEDTYRKRIDRRGAEEITTTWFPSATAASEHFGYGCNFVSEQLRAAKEKGESIAVVAGVPVQWADEVGGVN